MNDEVRQLDSSAYDAADLLRFSGMGQREEEAARRPLLVTMRMRPRWPVVRCVSASLWSLESMLRRAPGRQRNTAGLRQAPHLPRLVGGCCSSPSQQDEPQSVA
jgi:hypothetical protein